jgi:voltage-gated potassium channel Kch
MGYSRRTGFLAGLTVAQISEFSLIFIAMGVTLGQVSEQALGLVTLVGLITIAASTYMITYSHELYGKLGPWLGWFERKRHMREEDAMPTAAESFDVIVFGLGRYGLAIAQELRRTGLRILGVDFDPSAVRFARDQGFDVAFGDATDREILAHLPLAGVRWVVMAVPEHDTGITHDDPRQSLIHGLAELGFQGRIAMSTQNEANAERLRHAGAHLVLMPFRDAAAEAARLVAGSATPSDLLVCDPQGQKRLAS